jgi:hypothetical protein
MAECQSSSVERLTRRRPLQQLGRFSGRAGDPPAAAAGVDRITHNRVADVLQVNPDLMSAAGMELQPEQLRDIESCHH